MCSTCSMWVHSYHSMLTGGFEKLANISWAGVAWRGALVVRESRQHGPLRCRVVLTRVISHEWRCLSRSPCPLVNSIPVGTRKTASWRRQRAASSACSCMLSWSKAKRMYQWLGLSLVSASSGLAGTTWTSAGRACKQACPCSVTRSSATPAVVKGKMGNSIISSARHRHLPWHRAPIHQHCIRILPYPILSLAAASMPRPSPSPSASASASACHAPRDMNRYRLVLFANPPPP